ncbi:MAG: MmgE/PrpD family protein, partial [Comamonadaceae bacterium]
MTGLTQSLTNFIVNPTWGDGESGALGIANVGFIDTVATMMAGSREPVAQIVLAHARSTCADQSSNMSGGVPVPFGAISLPPPLAAYVNGVTAHALDYDDVALSGHTSTVLVPAILAEGHRLGISGLEALRAYVVGYEVWAELVAREPDPYHLKGWHPTGVFGTVAAAAAVAYLNKLSEADTRQALSIAASMASGLVANFGTMTKPLHAGRAAACGIDAVRLSVLGLTSAPDVFEHPAGFLNAISPSGLADRGRATDGLGQTLRIL